MNDEMATKDWRVRLNERRSEERIIKLIERLYRALLWTKRDAERNGASYDEQSVCVKAIKEYERWEQQRQKP